MEQEKNTQTLNEESLNDKAITSDDSLKDENKHSTDDSDKSKVFTQEDVNRIVQERLERFKRNHQDELEKAELEEKEKFKELYEKTLDDLEELKKEKALREREEEVITSLKNHGYDDEKARNSLKWVMRLIDDDSNVETVVKDYVDDHPTAYADPSASLGQKAKIQTDKTDDLIRDTITQANRFRKNIKF